jgi:L-asparaginase
MQGFVTSLRRLAQYLLAAVLIAAVASLPNPLAGASAPGPAQGAKPRIAVFSLTNATLQNSPPLVTSNKAREQHGLPLLSTEDGSPLRFDVVRPQRLAAPVTVYIEQFSAHPLERDAADVYAPSDGYVDASGTFSPQRRGPNDVPVYRATLRPEDGLYWLPYMARQASGQAWDGDCAAPGAPITQCRVPFYPDASRIFEEIDRFGLAESGLNSPLATKAVFDFYRPAPSGGYRNGLPAAQRTDVGSGDIPPEVNGQDFFPYRPGHLGTNPPLQVLARITNSVQRALASGQYAGAIWFQGSPRVEETAYWLNLLIDTPLPIVGNAAQREHLGLSSDGDRNVDESVQYILSGIWADGDGRDQVGSVLLQDQMVFNSREVQKGDARPGGYIVTGGHGGIVASMGDPAEPALTFVPVRRHTYTSAVNMSQLPGQVMGVRRSDAGIMAVPVAIKDTAGNLLESSIPNVTITKTGTYTADDFTDDLNREVDILAWTEKHLRDAPLAGFVAESYSPYGTQPANSRTAALTRAARSGLPVVVVGRGNNEGFTPLHPSGLLIGGNNLTATKARLLLMAALMKLGSLPAAADPDQPTPAELQAIRAKVLEYQAIFDTH